MEKRTYYFPEGHQIDLDGFGNIRVGSGGLYVTFRKPGSSPYLMDVNGIGYMDGKEVKLVARGRETNSSFENWARRNGQIKR